MAAGASGGWAGRDGGPPDTKAKIREAAGASGGGAGLDGEGSAGRGAGVGPGGQRQGTGGAGGGQRQGESGAAGAAAGHGGQRQGESGAAGAAAGPDTGRGQAAGGDARTRHGTGPDGGGADPLADAREQFRHVSLFWTDLIHLMASKPQALTSAGPMRNYAENAKAIATEMLAAGQDAAEFSEALSKYYDQLAATWASAQRKVDAKLPRIPNDLERFEAYKRVWIDMFDNDFTELFDSKGFGDNYGRLVSKELDLARHWNNIMNVVLRSANLPNKKDIDGVYRELHGLKRRISKLESENRRLRAAAEESGADGAPPAPGEGGADAP